jgi:hypothetical protein
MTGGVFWLGGMGSEELRGCPRTYVGRMGICRVGRSKLRSASSEDSGAMLRCDCYLAAMAGADSRVTDCPESTRSQGDEFRGPKTSVCGAATGNFRGSGR